MLARTGKMGYAVLVFVALAVMGAPAMAHAKEESGVAATVNGDKILKSDVMGVLKLNNVKDEDQAKAYPVVVDEIINEKLIDNAAAKADVEKNPGLQHRLSQAKEQLIKTVYIASFLKDKVTDKAVKAEYDKFKAE